MGLDGFLKYRKQVSRALSALEKQCPTLLKEHELASCKKADPVQLCMRGLGCGGSDIAHPGCMRCSIAGAAEPHKGAGMRLSCALCLREMFQGRAPSLQPSRWRLGVSEEASPSLIHFLRTMISRDGEAHVCGEGIKGMLKVMIHPMGMSKYYRSSSAECSYLSVN